MTQVLERPSFAGVQTDQNRLLQPGTSRIHISPSRSELSLHGTGLYKTVHHNSGQPHLNGEMFGSRKGCRHGGTEVLHKQATADGRLAVAAQAAPYTELSVLIAADQNRRGKSETRIEAFYPAQLPPETKLAYTTAKLVGLQSAWEQRTGESTSLVIEHLTPKVTTREHAYPRTIPIPHATLGVFEAAHIDPEAVKPAHVTAEQKTLRPHMAGLAQEMDAHIALSLSASGLSPEGVQVRVRGVEPLGYALHFKDITPEKLSDPAAAGFVTAVLDADHEGFSLKVKELADNLPAVIEEAGESFAQKPPGARHIMYVHEDTDGAHLAVIVSPLLYSRAGGLESSGVLLDRSPAYPRRHTREEIAVFQQNVNRKIIRSSKTVRSTR